MPDTHRSTPAFGTGGHDRHTRPLHAELLQREELLQELARWFAENIVLNEHRCGILPAAFRPYVAPILVVDDLYGWPGLAAADTYLRETFKWDDARPGSDDA